MNLAEVSIKRPIFITCLFVLTLSVGYLAMKRLPVDLFPDVTFPVVTVTTTYPGAGPMEIETLISKPIEDELSTIAGIKNVQSRNREGISSVTAEFHFSTDIKYSEQQVRDRVAFARRRLPDDAEESIIRRVDPADQPVMVVGVSADLPTAEMFDLAREIVRPKLLQVEQVGQIDVLGGRRREIRIDLDQTKLKQHEISASAVADRVAAAGENVPAGSVSDIKEQLVYRTLAEFRTLKDIESVIVNFFANERPVRVKDVGVVVDELEEEKARVLLNGRRTLTLQIFKQSGSNTIAVVEGLRKRVMDLNLQLAGEAGNIKLTVTRDNSSRIRANVVDVQESILIGIVLTILVVLFFLGSFRSTLITSLALPNSLLGAFILMAMAGFSINIMTLLALSLSVGLLVDDAIVVRENIFRHLEMGKSSFRASIDGTNEVLMAVIATTLTVVAVFGPIGFLQGSVGQFFKEFGITICFAMMISLLDALTMAPMLSAYFAGKAGHAAAHSNRVFRAFDRFQTRLENGYESLLKRVLNFPKTVLGIALAVFLVSLFSTKYITKTFLPAQDNGDFNVSFDLAPGTSLESTSKIANEVDQLVRSNPEVEQVLMVIGNRDGQTNKASLTVQLVPGKKRKKNTTQMKEHVREQLKPYAYANPMVSDINGTGQKERQFTLSIMGTNIEELEAYSKKLHERLKTNTALKDVDISQRPGKPEFQFAIDPEMADQVGVSTKTAGNELRTLIEGSLPAVFRQKGREYDIRVRLQEDQRGIKDRLHQTYIPNINGRLIPLTQVSKTVEKVGPAEIQRRNRNRTIIIEADINPTGPGMGAAIQSATRLLKEELKIPAGMEYAFVGQAESFKELMTNMAIAMALGVLFIYLVLASLYESFITPLTIMLVLPLALCGAFFGLLITGKSLDIFSMIGCVLLLGVATKNSILLVDYTQQLLAQGMERSAAIIKAGKTRLRPILMTSFALISGMIPIAIGLNEASKQRTSMGIAIIGGLISSTLLTLVVIPAAYSYIDRLRIWINHWFHKVASVETPAPAISTEMEKA